MSYKHFFKGFCFLFILPLFISCADEESVAIPNMTSPANPHYVTYQQALNTAIHLLSNDKKQTRADAFIVKNHYEYSLNKGYSSHTRSIKDLEDTIDVRFHIINFEDNAGFALVSADDRTTPVYAYSTEGLLNIEDAISNTGFGDFMENAKVYYKYEANGGKGPGDGWPLPFLEDPFWIESLPTTQFGGRTVYVYSRYETQDSVAPLLMTQWGQDDPYNYYCPEANNMPSNYNGRCPAGCVPIALAQLMAYYKYAKNTTDIEGYPIFLRWNNLHNQVSFPSGDSSFDCRALAKLIRKIGDVGNATYTNTGTGVATIMVDSILHYFGYSTSGLQTSLFDNGVLLKSLDNNKPIYVRGERTTANGNIGHGWVVDGYSHKEIVEDLYAYTTPHYHLFTLHTLECLDYFHCNWGWNGLYNAYVLNFKANEDRQYSINNSYIYNITPQQ